MIRFRERYQEKKFRIICLKRSKFRESTDFEYTSKWYLDCDIVYWCDDFSGYTNDIEEAGEYTLDEISNVAGKFLDWIIEPVWRS